MLTWRLGEKRYAYAKVTQLLGESFTITSALYTIYDTADESVVASGNANTQADVVYTLWQPPNAGIFVVRFDYNIGSQTFSNEQVIDVKETV